MELKEAKEILNNNGYYLLETSTYVGFPFMRILWERILREADKNENKLETHSIDPSKWIDVDFYLGNLRIYRTNTGIRGEFDNGRKFTYKTIGQNKWNAADECAKFIISVVNGEISERKAKEKLERLNFKESTQSSFIEDFKAWINGREGEQYEEKEIIDYGWELIAQDVGYPNGHKTYYDYYKIDVDGITYKLEVAWNSFNETIVGNKIWKENENV